MIFRERRQESQPTKSDLFYDLDKCRDVKHSPSTSQNGWRLLSLPDNDPFCCVPPPLPFRSHFIIDERRPILPGKVNEVISFMHGMCNFHKYVAYCKL